MTSLDAAPPVAEACSDRIVLQGVSGYGHHGVFDFERERGQQFLVDVACSLDLSRAAASDDVRDTIDYGELARSIHEDIESEPVHLLETLADRVARTCLRQAAVQEVEVTVRKPAAPMPVEVASVAVSLRRRRPDATRPAAGEDRS